MRRKRKQSLARRVAARVLLWLYQRWKRWREERALERRYSAILERGRQRYVAGRLCERRGRGRVVACYERQREGVAPRLSDADIRRARLSHWWPHSQFAARRATSSPIDRKSTRLNSS